MAFWTQFGFGSFNIAQVVAGLPASRSVITGYYATGHSMLGQPTPRYVSRLLQTLAAQDLCTGVRAYRKEHHMQAGVGHYGVFSGRKWNNEIYPLLRDFIHVNS